MCCVVAVARMLVCGADCMANASDIKHAGDAAIGLCFGLLTSIMTMEAGGVIQGLKTDSRPTGSVILMLFIVCGRICALGARFLFTWIFHSLI